MPASSRPPLLRRWVRGRREHAELDLADMGTAFALDLALDQPALETAPADVDKRVVPVAAWRLWLGRKLGA